MKVRHCLWCAAVTALTLTLSAGSAEAKKKTRGKGGNQVKVGTGLPSAEQLHKNVEQIDKEIQSRQKSLAEANKSLEKAQQEHRSAEQQHRSQQKELSQAKKFAAMTAKADPKWQAAREQLVTLQKEMAELRKQIVESIRDKEDYRQAVQLHEAALAEQRSSRSAEASEETRKALAVKVSATAQAIRTIEDVALANHSGAKEVMRRLKEAETDVAQAAKKAHTVEENDSKVASAKVGFMRTNGALKEATQRLEVAQSHAGGIQSGIQALHAQKSSLASQELAMKKLSPGGGTNKGKGKK